MNTRRIDFTVIMAIAASVLFIAGNAQAATYQVIGGGLDAGGACLSSTGAGGCSTASLFGVNGSFAVTGTITFNASDTDIDITLASAVMDGTPGYNGATAVAFNNVNYSTSGWNTTSFGSQVFGLGASSGVAQGGTYTSLDAGNSPIFGPVGFAEATGFTGLSCNLTGGTGICGFTVGANRDFNILAGDPADSFDVRQTFNFSVQVIPEPRATLLFIIGLVLVGGQIGAGRRAARC
jgi:hypothetical protein